MTGRQLALDSDFRRAGLVAVLGIGSSPGKTNVMADRAVRELGGSADSIDVAAAGRDPRASGAFSPPYAVQTLIDELTLTPVVLRDGQPVEIEPLAPGGTVDYGPPIGNVETIHTLHSELATFGESFGCREASFRLSLAPALLSRLRELASAPAEEVSRATREAVARSAETVSVDVVIARGGLTATGALPPERCIEPEPLFAELESRGCRFEVLDATGTRIRAGHGVERCHQQALHAAGWEGV